MKKSIRESLNKLVVNVAKRGANSASIWEYYQPKEPQALKKLKK